MSAEMSHVLHPDIEVRSGFICDRAARLHDLGLSLCRLLSVGLAKAPNDMLLEPLRRHRETLGLKQGNLRILEVR